MPHWPEVLTLPLRHMVPPPAEFLRKLLSEPLSEAPPAKELEASIRQAIQSVPDDVLKELGLLPPARADSQPKGNAGAALAQRLEEVQAFINAFQYNHTSRQYFNVSKNRSLARIMDTAREIIRVRFRPGEGLKSLYATI